jgi:mannosyltransferase OCH1-like enzyme
VIENLESYNRNFGLPYLTVMYSTGPLFFSVCWIMYLWKGSAERIRVLVRAGAEGDSYGFFRNVQGGSWHGKDTEVVFWMGRHWVLVTLVGFVIGFTVVGVCWLVLGRLSGRSRRCEKDRGRARCRDV